AREDLVDRVPGSPEVIDVVLTDVEEVRRLDVAEEGVLVGNAADVPVAPRLLHPGELVDDVRDALEKSRVSGRGVGQGARRQVMPEGVARETLGLPAAVELALWR